MIFAMSDICGYYEVLKERIDQIMPYLKEGDHRLALLGNYIGRGKSSYQCIKMIFDLQKELGEDKVIVLAGENERSFVGILYGCDGVWIDIDMDMGISSTFLTEEQLEEMKNFPRLTERLARLLERGLITDSEVDGELLSRQHSFVKKCVRTNDRELISWMGRLEDSYETEAQIFVHTGIDDSIKALIAGHAAVPAAADVSNFENIYFDEKKHYYVGGSIAHTNRLLCLAYDEDTKEYYEFMEDGTFNKIG